MPWQPNSINILNSSTNQVHLNTSLQPPNFTTNFNIIIILLASGKHIRSAFNQIDFRRTGLINPYDLAKALARVDLKVSDEDIEMM
jgi:Ca2+-binding EF-hand superfamily protein